MSTYELTPQHDTRASFYGKAIVTDAYAADGTVTLKLMSYGTIVATIKRTVNPGDIGEAEIYDTYSTTTLRHIKEFLLQNGFKAVNKAQMLADYVKASTS